MLIKLLVWSYLIMSPVRAYLVVKCKKAALCGHTTLAPDCHSLCFRCKPLSKSTTCTPNDRCSECVTMLYRNAAILYHVTLMYHVVGKDLVICRCKPVEYLGKVYSSLCTFRFDSVKWPRPHALRSHSSFYSRAKKNVTARTRVCTVVARSIR